MPLDDEPLIKRDILVDRVNAAKGLLELEKYKYSAPATSVIADAGIDVYLKDKLVGSLHVANINMETIKYRAHIELQYVSNMPEMMLSGTSPAMPANIITIILSVGTKAFEISCMEFDNMKRRSLPWPTEVPRYAEYDEMPMSKSLRFKWLVLQVEEKDYEDLFDHKEFLPA